MPSLNHCDLLRHVGVNNLPKVVTRQRRGRELNSQPASCESNALATRLPSYQWPPCVADADVIFCSCGFFLWSPYVVGQTIIFSSCGSYLLSFFPRLISAVGDWMSNIIVTWCGPSVNLECRSETCYAWLAGNTGRKKSPSRHHRTTFSGHIFATKVCIDNWQKNLLSSNTSSTCPDNMVNFGPLTAEIGSGVWGIPANFNGFRVLAALLHGM